MKKPRYELEGTPFYRMPSPRKLAEILFVSAGGLEEMANSDRRYYDFQKTKKSGGTRPISAPIKPLKKVQKRIAELLARVLPPDFLFAPVAGRCYVSNAALHRGARSIRLLDIEDFFPSCTVNKVAWFFGTQLQCAPDVAALLTKIVTHNGVLPQGSPCSPILAYFCYMDMWQEIDALARGRGCKLSVYVDDITISGEVVPEEMVWSIKQCLRRHGHKHAPDKERSKRDRTAEVTGIVIKNDCVLLPNRQNHKIDELRKKIRETPSPTEREKLDRQLRGRLAQRSQVLRVNR